MEKSYFSGKAGRHAVKTQYSVNIYGQILHKTRHSPGRVHDVKAYKMKHPAVPKNLPRLDGAANEGERANLRHYLDRGYRGAQEADPEVGMRLPIRKKPGKKLTSAEEFNRAHSRIRVYAENAIHRIKTCRIMGDRYRNPLKKYDLINDIICGLVNQELLLRATGAA